MFILFIHALLLFYCTQLTQCNFPMFALHIQYLVLPAVYILFSEKSHHTTEWKAKLIFFFSPSAQRHITKLAKRPSCFQLIRRRLFFPLYRANEPKIHEAFASTSLCHQQAALTSCRLQGVPEHINKLACTGNKCLNNS